MEKTETKMTDKKKVRFTDLFSGIGGFRLGLERADDSPAHKLRTQGRQRSENKETNSDEGGSLATSQGGSHSRQLCRFRCVWANDWVYADFKWMRNKKTGKLEWKGTRNLSGKVYVKHWNDGTYIDADIKTVDASSIPDHELLCAGFPCPSFSVAGKRKGFEDPRGTLFLEICRIAKAKRPQLLLLENVKGLLSHDKGLTFQIILESLEKLGYWVEWQVLNSKHFGVPQNRERVFVVGHLGNNGGREVFPIIGNDKAATENGSVVRTLQGGAHSGGLHSRMTAIGITLANTSRYKQGVKRTPLKQDDSSWALNSAGDQGVLIQIGNIFSGEAADGRVYDPKGISPSLRGFSFGWSKPKIMLGSQKPTVRKGGRGSIDRHAWDTLHDGSRIRRLTPIECERLQGFSDGWTEGISDTQRYKTLGNAVTTNVIEFLGKRILEKVFD